MTDRPTAAQCWLKRAHPVFDGTSDTLLTPLKFIPVHGSTPNEAVEPAPGASTDGAGSLSEWLA